MTELNEADVLPGTYRGLEGVQVGSGTRKWAPFGAKYANGTLIKSFYDHHYRTEREHYHVTHEDLQKCAELYP